jgi:hypothetical protein
VLRYLSSLATVIVATVLALNESTPKVLCIVQLMLYKSGSGELLLRWTFKAVSAGC